MLQTIFTGWRLTGDLTIAEAQRQEALYFYVQTILTAFKEVEDALIAYQQAQELVRVQKDRVEAIKEYLKLSWLRYYEGETDYLTVLDAERQLFRVELDLTQAQGNTFLSLIDIYKSLGGGWVLDADHCLTGN